MIAASGTLAYEDISGIVDAIIYGFGRRVNIPGMTHADIAQEIRFECYKAISKYDSNRIGPSPYNYLLTCVQNKMYNLRRGTYVPNNPPCVRCELWDKTNKICKINEENCEPIQKYRAGMKTKAAIRGPSALGPGSNLTKNHDATNDIMLQDDLKTILPENLYKDYLKLMLNEEISTKSRKEIKRIISDYLDLS